MRLDKKLVFVNQYLKYQLKKKYSAHDLVRGYLKDKEYVHGQKALSAEDINQVIREALLSDQPFMAGRFGATELYAVRTFDFEIAHLYESVVNQMQLWSGFFPATNEAVNQFKDLLIPLISESDIMGVWVQPFEQYYLEKYGAKNLKTTYLLDLEPWSAPHNPWSAVLKGKKVLVIHPFKETILSQYKKREELFPGTDILPEFDLHVLKAVQTIAGEKDERFETWFDALEWMYQEALKIDFDVAIIGCGAYGFPLAAKLKQAGKKAIHLAGATQLLFGIKGKRWEENEAFAYVQKFFNDAWVYPGEADKPKQAGKVEGGCYW